MISLQAIDTFKVQKNFFLSGEDIATLSLMYLPLIGIDSNSTYLLLHTMTDEQHSFKKLLDMLNFENALYLDNSLKKLEAVGLIKRYYNQAKGYLLVLEHPLDAKSFLSHPLLSSFLKDKIGPTEHTKLKNLYLTTMVKNYEDLTASFSDVYKSTSKAKSDPLVQMFRNKLRDNILIKNRNFDYSLFKLSFDDNEIDLRILNDQTFINEIMRISFQYQLDEKEMKQAIIDCIRFDNDITYEAISHQALRQYRNKRGNDEVTFVLREPDAFVVGSDNSNEDEIALIEKLESMSIADILSTINQSYASATEIKMFDELAKNFNLPIGVVNYMILLVNAEKDGQLPSIAYFEKIASNWTRAKISSVGEAIKFVSEYKTKATKKTTRKKKEVELPDWFAEFNEQSKVDTTEEVVDQQQALEAWKKLFGGD